MEREHQPLVIRYVFDVNPSSVGKSASQPLGMRCRGGCIHHSPSIDFGDIHVSGAKSAFICNTDDGRARNGSPVGHPQSHAGPHCTNIISNKTDGGPTSWPFICSTDD